MKTTQPNESAAGGTVPAWDLPTRAFKWSLVILVACGWISHRYGDAAMVWHKFNGYALLTLLVWRLLWGFGGGASARFSLFVPWPGKVVRYALDLLARRPRHFLSHNPLGALMVLALMGLLLAQTGTGLFSNDDVLVDGPLRGYVSDALSNSLSGWHGRIFNVILGFAAIHILVNVFHGLAGEPLIQAMLTGRKPAEAYEDIAASPPGSMLAAICCLVIASALVFGGLAVFGNAAFR